MKNNNSKSFFSDPQNIIAIGVTVISLCALMVSIMQTRIMSEQRALMYEQAKASVWPRLQIDRNKGHQRKDYRIIDYHFVLSNAGVGPAMITDVRFSVNGNIVKNWSDIIRSFNLPDSVETYINSGSINNSMIKIGEDLVFFDLGGKIPNRSSTPNLPLAQYFYKNEKSFKMEIWYKSIYGDKWKLTYEKGNATYEEVDKDFSLTEEEQFEN